MRFFHLHVFPEYLVYPFSMRPLESLSLDAMVDLLSRAFHSVPDPRDPTASTYPLHDTLMSGFACMFFQHPSLLEFQRSMKSKRKLCNLETIFRVRDIPSDTQMRDILDGAPIESLRGLLPELFERVRRAGWAGDFKTTIETGAQAGDYYTLALDGSDYFHSTKIECPCCLHRKDKQGETHYYHTVVAATLVRARSHRIFPLDVEEVKNTDGSEKQDCELNAAKRLIARFREEHRQMRVIVTGDDLYSHGPFLEQLESNRLHYVIVAKPDSHKEMFEWVEEIDSFGGSLRGSWQEGPASKRRYYEYRVVKQVPINGERKTFVTFIEVWERKKEGELLYHNSWVTDLDVTEENVAKIMWIGRSKWKIENEQFNVQKNHGYELEHNYGHGKKGLGMVFYFLNLLAFVVHQILERGDRLYRKIRQEETLRELWNGLRTLMKMMLFESWKAMLERYVEDEGRSP